MKNLAAPAKFKLTKTVVTRFTKAPASKPYGSSSSLTSTY